MKLIIRWLIIAASLFLAAWIVPGIQVVGNAWIVFGVTAIVLGLLNAIIRPVLKFLSCGFIFITMGLFSIVINASMLILASNLAQNWFDVGFYIDNFWSALLGSLIVSVVSMILGNLLKEKKSKK
ncbi:MAG: phage holin family protein [Anaerolineaceae bacterium]|nr:phage holin family protein [Anaerolineaceae bacterium]